MTRRLARLALTFALIACGLAASGSTATASTAIGTSGATVTARGPVTLNWSGTNLICTFTFDLGFERVISKAVGSTLGQRLAAGSSITNCNGGINGTFTSDATASYISWGGSLPSSITSINAVVPVAYYLTGGTTFGVNRCPYTANLSLSVTGPGTSLTGMSLSGAVRSSGAVCPASMRITNAAMTFSSAVPISLI